MSRNAPHIALRPADRRELDRLARSLYTAQGVAMRARIVLAAAQKLTNQAIARQLGVTKATVGKWRSRFVSRGVAGLEDQKRPGRPNKYDQRIERRLLFWVRHKPPPGKGRWTVRTLANFLDVPRSTIHDLLGRVRLPRSRYLPWRRVRA